MTHYRIDIVKKSLWLNWLHFSQKNLHVMFYCLTHLVLKRSKAFKWPLDKTVLHLTEKLKGGPITEHLSFYQQLALWNPPNQCEISQPTFVGWSRENMVGLVMFWSLSRPRFTYSLYWSFCYTSHYQTLGLFLCIWFIKRVGFSSFAMLVIIKTLCVCVHLVYQENSSILFWSNINYLRVNKSSWWCQQDSSWSTFGCWYLCVFC